MHLSAVTLHKHSRRFGLADGSEDLGGDIRPVEYQKQHCGVERAGGRFGVRSWLFLKCRQDSAGKAGEVLQVEVGLKRGGIGRTAGLHTVQAAAQRFEFLFDYFPIHAARLSFSIWLRRGMKSAASTKCRLINRPCSAALPSRRRPCRTIWPSRGCPTAFRSIKSMGLWGLAAITRSILCSPIRRFSRAKN